MAHEIGAARNLRAVDADFPFVLVNIRLYGHLSVTVFRLGGNPRGVRTDTDQLLVAAYPQRRARAQIKHRLGTVGLSLRVFAEKDIQPVGKGEFLVPVISEILKRQIFYLHNPRKTRRKYFLFL